MKLRGISKSQFHICPLDTGCAEREAFSIGTAQGVIKDQCSTGWECGTDESTGIWTDETEEFQLQVEGMVVVQCRRCCWCSLDRGEEMSWLLAKAAVSWVSLQAARTARSCHCLCPGQTQPWGHPGKAPWAPVPAVEQLKAREKSPGRTRKRDSFPQVDSSWKLAGLKQY